MSWLIDILNRILGGDVAPPAPSPPPPPPGPLTAPSGLVAAINAQRAIYGLAPLRESASLDAVAGVWAATMARIGTLSHGSFAGRIEHAFPNTAAGEDIAEGQIDVEAVVTTWMNSPPHRANILGKYDLVGAGEARAADGTLYWCVDFDATAPRLAPHRKANGWAPSARSPKN
jgi:uncharacterized protein YkwD